MEIQNVLGFEVRMPEKSQQQKFTEEKKAGGKDGVILNKKRRDARTRGLADSGDPDKWMSAEFKNKRDVEFGTQDVKEDSIDVKEELEELDWKKEQLDEKNREGMEVFNEHKDASGVVHVNEETVSADENDGWFEYFDEEPSEQEIYEAEQALEAKEKREEEARKLFYGDRPYRSGSQRVRGIR